MAIGSHVEPRLVLQKTKRLLFWTPLLLIVALISGMVMHLIGLKYSNPVLTGLSAAIFGFTVLVIPHYVLGKTARLLGLSWVYFGLLPILFIPIGMLVSWLTLVDKRSKLKKSLHLQEAGAARLGS